MLPFLICPKRVTQDDPVYAISSLHAVSYCPKMRWSRKPLTHEGHVELINVCRHLTTPEQEEFGFIRIKRKLVFQAPILKSL